MYFKNRDCNSKYCFLHNTKTGCLGLQGIKIISVYILTILGQAFICFSLVLVLFSVPDSFTFSLQSFKNTKVNFDSCTK